MSIQQITDFLKRQAELNVKRRILPSPTVDVANGGGGYELYAKIQAGVDATPEPLPAPSTLTSFPCKITAVNGDFYEVDVYAYGRDVAVTSSGILQVLELNIDAHLSVDDWVIGHSNSVKIVGDGTI